MRTLSSVAVLLAIALGLAMPPAFATTDQQALVDRARVTVGDLKRQSQVEARDLFHRARAVLIIPRFYKAGFFVGGAGGKGVLLVHAGPNSWSAPAFYTIGSASSGLQVGLEQSEMALFIVTQKGLDAVMENKVTLGAGGGLAVATIGGNVGGATTTAAGADIVTWAASQGAYAGISLEGSVLAPDTDADSVYYGRPVTTRQVLDQMEDRQPTGTALQRELASVR
jgi:lipid-binding SYLF domain-containing protein